MLKEVKLNVSEQEVLDELYDLVLDTDIKASEREVLLKYKNEIEEGKNFSSCIAQLTKILRPYAIKQELSPKVVKFYVKAMTEKGANVELGRGLISLGVGGMR